MKATVLLTAFMANALFLIAQPPCPDGRLSLIVEIRTDQYASETAWSVTDVNGNAYGGIGFNTYANNTFYQTQVCVPDSTCINFSIFDSYGDGIFLPGFYRLILEGDTLAQNSAFGDFDQYSFNCSAGESCALAIPVDTLGIYATLHDDTWYTFSPDSLGTYTITTCGLNGCDTKIWIYDTCDGITVAEDNQSTIFFNDDESDCAPQAVVTGYFEPGKTYLIRIGDNQGGCPDSIPITWEITYDGPVVGCTDPASCNYNPLATIDDGSCIPQGDPDCPAGPDLLVRQDILANSIYLTTINSTDACLISEGCLHGYGLRDIIRFTTWIANDGELDYYIGQPSYANNQFTWDNCHNHFHYDGYAEYILFAEDGTQTPIGFKNGFCVIDLGCTTGSPQYGCGNMGISAGCHDIYSSGLECQWIDVTDVPDGRYIFVTRVNWDNAPDRLGRVERDTLNNWAQVCIILDRSSGQLQMTLDPECEPYVDCTGAPYGNVQMDCNGDCGGTALPGDLNQDGLQEMPDAQEYVLQSLAGDITPTPCIDLNADGSITVFDASLLASCINFGTNHPHLGSGAHDHCNFPSGVLNTTDTVSLSIMDVDFEEGYIDIGIYNRTTRVNAYDFRMSGIQIMQVENLAPDSIYPINPMGSLGRVIGISYQDSTLEKTSEVQPLCRIHFSEITDNFICISEILDIVNKDQERVVALIENGCVEYTPSRTASLNNAIGVQLFPNPFSRHTRLVFDNPRQESFRLEVAALNGQVLRRYEGLTGNEVLIDGAGLPEGIYWFRLSGAGGFATGKMSLLR